MATKIILVDDLDNRREANETVRFAVDGREYEIDLTTENAARLRGMLREFIEAARKVGQNGSVRVGAKRPATIRGGAASGYDKQTLKEIREWARTQGETISDRGRIAVTIVQAWENRDKHASMFTKGRAALARSKAVQAPRVTASATTSVKKTVAPATERPASSRKIPARSSARPAGAKRDPQPGRTAKKTPSPAFSAKGK